MGLSNSSSTISNTATLQGLCFQLGSVLQRFAGESFQRGRVEHRLQYEYVKEVYTTSVPGFMSQIGGKGACGSNLFS